LPAESDSQRRLFCLALSIKQGKTPASYSKQAAKIAGQTSEQQLTEFCENK